MLVSKPHCFVALTAIVWLCHNSSTHLPVLEMDVCVASSLWLLQIRLPWIFVSTRVDGGALSSLLGDGWIRRQEYVGLVKKLANFLPQRLYYFSFPSAVSRHSSRSTSFPTLGTTSLYRFSRSNKSGVVSCGFNSRFPSDLDVG